MILTMIDSHMESIIITNEAVTSLIQEGKCRTVTQQLTLVHYFLHLYIALQTAYRLSIFYFLLSLFFTLVLFFLQKPQSRSLSTSSGHSVFDSRRHLMELDEGELFMELIRDVANELDIDVLCHKILVNVGLLTHADRGSLFLAKGPPNNKYLVAKLFDVTQLDRRIKLSTFTFAHV